MLHFIYNGQLVGVLVSHSHDTAEYVLQIPMDSQYFPLYPLADKHPEAD